MEKIYKGEYKFESFYDEAFKVYENESVNEEIRREEDYQTNR